MTGVSFVVPVYNKAAFLPDVLQAIRNQRGDFARQYVFVDDGSTDESIQIVRDAVGDWGDVVIHLQENHGSAHATNQAINRTRHPFVKFVDADDLIKHDTTALFLNQLTDSDACLAFGRGEDYDSLDEIDLETIDRAAPFERMASPLEASIRNSLFNPSRFMARRECLLAVGGCDERVVHSQEFSLTMRLARRWPFLRTDAVVAYLPREVPGRLGNNNAKQLRRVNLATQYFIADHPQLPDHIKRLACRRAAGRAWKYVRRNHDAGFGSRWFWRNMQAKLPITPPDPAGFIEGCTAAFDLAEASHPTAPDSAATMNNRG